MVACVMFGSAGCDSGVKRRRETISQGVYAVNDGLNKGRYDVSFRYSAELVKLVPPPEKRIEVKPIKIPVARAIYAQTDSKPSVSKRFGNIIVDITGRYIDAPDTSLGENAIILPPSAAGKIVIVEDSAEYQELLEKYSAIKKQIEKEQKEKVKFENKVAEVQRDDAKTIEKIETGEKGVFAKIGSFFSWFSFFGLTGIIITTVGLLVVCILFPPLLPLVMSAVGRLFSASLSAVNLALFYLGRIFRRKPTIDS